MADQPSSAAKKLKKKGGGIIKFVRDLIKRAESTNDSTNQSLSTQVSVPGNDAGSAEPTASSKCILSLSCNR